MNTPGTRPPAVAGKFYPASSGEIAEELDRCFAAANPQPDPRPARAMMLPHAGWIFCGDIIAETAARTRIPPEVVVIGPKHTPWGANWSVSADDAWQLPGLRIPVATGLVQTLREQVPRLECERDAHHAEHGCEVLLPFLHRLQPDLRIVPIAIADATLDELRDLGAALATLRADTAEPPLLVISSDLNHFADDTENRRRDQLALARLQAADPQGLFNTCLEHDISMCGMRPAVAVLSALLAGNPACTVEITRYETSARITGDFSQVVGYAGALMR